MRLKLDRRHIHESTPNEIPRSQLEGSFDDDFKTLACRRCETTMNAQEMIVLAMQASIVIIVFGFGLRATLDDTLYIWRRPWRFARSFVAMFFVMPIIAIALDKTFNFHHEIEIALVALALSPVPPLLLKKGGKAGGRSSFALGLLVTMAILSIVVLPAGVRLLELAYGRSFALPPTTIVT